MTPEPTAVWEARKLIEKWEYEDALEGTHLQPREIERLANKIAVYAAAQRQAVEGERDRWRDDWRTTNDALVVAQQIGDTFWEALKPLKLTHINVANPGQHVTDLIADLTASEAAREQARKALGQITQVCDKDWCECAASRIAYAALTPGAAAPRA